MDLILNLIDKANDLLWAYIVIPLLVACALYFTWRLRGMQFRSWGEMWRLLKSSTRTPGTHKPETGPVCQNTNSGGQGDGRLPDCTGQTAENKRSEKKHISSFQAFAVSLSSRVGTGNLAGVASAIFVGGPGAVFWMWLMALLGSSTAFVESTLAQLYKRRGKDSFYGGPAYYMTHGLHRRWMGVLFAVLITLTFGLANQLVQSNTLCAAIAESLHMSNGLVGIILAAATLFIVFGGIQRISKFAATCVPFMAIGYILLALIIVILNIKVLPDVIMLIVKSAFGIKQVGAGMLGLAVMQGVKRGLFSNEAGEGSAPNAAATATISHPIKQGYLQALGVFTDTILICSCTAFIILISGKWNEGLDGILLTSASLEFLIGPIGRWFLLAAIFLFAYSTLIGNYFYGENNIRFITGQKWAVQIFRVITGLIVVAGALMTLQTAWSLVDFVMGLMTIVNLVAIVLLFPKVHGLFHDYRSQRRQGKDPVFHRDTLPSASPDLDTWD